MYTAFQYSIKRSGYKVKMNCNKRPWQLEQNNYAAKVVNAYIVFDLDKWANNPLRNFISKNCLLGSNNILTK